MENSQPAISPPPLSIEGIARSSASILLLIYGLGFVIIGFHDAKYGVVQFSPFRARIVLVGFVFAVLIALAAGAQHFGFMYIAPLESVKKDSDPQRRLPRETVLTAGFIYTAMVMSNLLGMFLFRGLPAQKVEHPTRQLLVWLATYALGYAIFTFAGRIFCKRPLLSALLSFLAFIILFGAFTETDNSNPRTYLTAMFALVGWHVTWIKRTGSGLKYAADFTNWLSALLLLWIYISQVFGSLPPRWGGGQPTPIVIFQNNAPSWSPSNPLEALLLDETDQGFYVLLSATGKAFFVPRSNVASVFFGSKDDLSKKQP